MIMNNATITVKTDEEVKTKAKALFSDLGLDMSSAINMFLRQCIKEEGIPFRVSKRLNPLTEQAIHNTENGIGMHGPFDSFDEMMEDIENAED